MTRSAGWFVVVLALISAAAAGAEDDPARLIERGQWRRARAVLEPFVAAHPADARAAVQLGNVMSAFGESEKALALAQKAATLDPGSAEARYAVAEIYGEKAQKAGVLSQLGLAKKFKKEAEAAAALDPKHVESRVGLLMFHCKAPGIAGGDKKRARALVDEIGRIDAEQGCFARAKFAEETKDTNAVEPALRKAVEVAPRSYEAHVSLAEYWLAPWRSGHAAEAERHVRLARDLDPARPGAWILLAVLLADGARWNDLDAMLAESEASLGDDRAPWYQAGRVALAKDPGRAERYFRRFLEKEPEPRGPGLAHARWRLSQALEKQGRRNEAIAELETAIRMKPDLDAAKKDLKRLRS